MPASWRRGIYEKVEYVFVERDGVVEKRQIGNPEVEEATATTSQPLRASYTRRQAPSPTEVDTDSDDDDDNDISSSLIPRTTITSAAIESAPSPVRHYAASQSA